MQLAREHPVVHDRLRFLFATLAEHTNVAGALESRLVKLRAAAAELAVP